MAPSTTRKRKSNQDRIADSTIDLSDSADFSSQQQLPVRAKDENENLGAHAETPSSSLKAPATGTLKMFNDDDETEVTRTKADTPGMSHLPIVVADSESEGSDEDAAPEAVSTQRAASEVKKSAQAAQLAAQEQAAAHKRKRQQRDALFQQQAEERKKKTEASRASTTTASATLRDDVELARKQQTLPSGRRRLDRLPIPTVLPAEFLTDDSGEDEDEEMEDVDARPKGRKVATVERQLSRQRNRRPRDRVVGQNVYRVVHWHDERMAPKVKKHSKGTRDALLKRNYEVAKRGRGFFTSK